MKRATHKVYVNDQEQSEENICRFTDDGWDLMSRGQRIVM